MRFSNSSVEVKDGPESVGHPHPRAREPGRTVPGGDGAGRGWSREGTEPGL